MNKNNYDNKQLNENNIHKYMIEEFGSSFITERKTLYRVPCLLQNDFGEKNDCTLTSITACLSYLLGISNYDYIYATVLFYARTYGFSTKNGTNPLCIKKIYDSAYYDIVGEQRKSSSKYLKNVGVTEKVIINNIQNNIPMILSFMSDGRNYYHNHSVTIIGYTIVQYKFDNKKTTMLLRIYDNWSNEISYIDFKKLSTVCSINY